MIAPRPGWRWPRWPGLWLGDCAWMGLGEGGMGEEKQLLFTSHNHVLLFIPILQSGELRHRGVK